MLIILSPEVVLKCQRRFRRFRSVDKPVDERRFADGFASDDQQVPFGSETSGNGILQFLLLLSNR